MSKKAMVISRLEKTLSFDCIADSEFKLAQAMAMWKIDESGFCKLRVVNCLLLDSFAFLDS